MLPWKKTLTGQLDWCSEQLCGQALGAFRVGPVACCSSITRQLSTAAAAAAAAADNRAEHIEPWGTHIEDSTGQKAGGGAGRRVTHLFALSTMYVTAGNRNYMMLPETTL